MLLPSSWRGTCGCLACEQEQIQFSIWWALWVHENSLLNSVTSRLYRNCPEFLQHWCWRADQDRALKPPLSTGCKSSANPGEDLGDLNHFCRWLRTPSVSVPSWWELCACQVPVAGNAQASAGWGPQQPVVQQVLLWDCCWTIPA